MTALAEPPRTPGAAPPAAEPTAARGSGGSRGSTPARQVRTGRGAPVLDVRAARGLAFLALAAFGALHWMALLDPAGSGRAWAIVGVGVLAWGALALVARMPARPAGRRRAALTAATVVLVLLAATTGGILDDLLHPGRWGTAAGGILRAISDLPGVRVPYRGLDPWVRTVIPLGASALVLAAALLAFWPRTPAGTGRERVGHPMLALVALVVLYIVPSVSLALGGEFVRGALLALLVLVYLRLEHLRRTDAAAGAALVVGVVVAGLAAAPLLDRPTPWFDYEAWANDTAASRATRFSWDHSYGPLRWPRDGRELLRVTAKFPAYWKAENLDVFDGREWRHQDPRFENTGLPDADVLAQPSRQRYVQNLRVSIRNLDTTSFVSGGITLRPPFGTGAESFTSGDGVFEASRTLERGDSYGTRVYTPQPTSRQRTVAGTDYPAGFTRYTTLEVPFGPATAAAQRVTFPNFGTSRFALRTGPPTESTQQVNAELEASPLARTWQLSQQLKTGVRTPEDYVQRVLAYLQDGYGYSEDPPRASLTLDGFLFDGKIGYCQQFSGAMAMLLRMAGIPSRVASGFTSGAFDKKNNEYIVRDLDAHSWVEVYYPTWGWVTFDPTPAIAPARNQPDEDAESSSSSSSSSNRGATSRAPSLGGDAPSSRADGTTATAESGPPWLLIGGGGVAAVALAAGGLLLVRRRRERGRSAQGGRRPVTVSELERALRRARRDPGPGVTLRSLEEAFARTPQAAAYVRSLREARYGRSTVTRPTRRQRRGLRSELARGGGVLGRLRAWWALPPS